MNILFSVCKNYLKKKIMKTTVQIEKIIEGYDNNQCDNTCSTVKFLVEASVEFALQVFFVFTFLFCLI